MEPSPREGILESGTGAASSSVDPEVLARLVVQCRELRLSVEQVADRFPGRQDTPFLYRQLDEAASRLNETIRALGSERGHPPAARLDETADLAARDKRSLFGRLFRKKEAPAAPVKDPSRTADLQGTSWTIPVSELLSFLSISRKTGTLWIHTPRETFLVEMKNGALVHATSDQTPQGMRIGDLLVMSGALPADRVEALVADARAAGVSLGTFLVKHGHVTTEALEAVLSKQVQNLFHRLITSENAVYRFQEGRAGVERNDLKLSVTGLLLESARFHDELASPRAVERALEEHLPEIVAAELAEVAKPEPAASPEETSSAPSAEAILDAAPGALPAAAPAAGPAAVAEPGVAEPALASEAASGAEVAPRADETGA